MANTQTKTRKTRTPKAVAKAVKAAATVATEEPKSALGADWAKLPEDQWRGKGAWKLPARMQSNSKYARQVLAVQSAEGLSASYMAELYPSDAGPRGKYGAALACACGVARALGEGYEVEFHLPILEDEKPEFAKGAARVVKN